MTDLLVQLYGETEAQQVFKKIESLINTCRDTVAPSGIQSDFPYEFTQKDIVLITYPDQLSDGQHPPLTVLLDFLLTHIKDNINTVHILPFFPYSSDDGFSIINYLEVDKASGGWEEISTISKRYRLMCDAVLNHISCKSRWFQGFLAGEPEYSEYFITWDPDIDLSDVTRPRPYPLLTPFDTKQGEKWLWTTFSEDQIDLNYKNPDVLIEMIRVILFYVRKGARIIRLDAIAYIWKEQGTNCIHRPEVHTIVKLFRKILDKILPQTVLITETNVPHEENISYFGTGGDEAQMVYQFPLPPLIVHALLNETAFYLCKWALNLTLPKGCATFFNFTASHDGIGLRPLKGLVPEKDIDNLVQITRQKGGDVSYKTNDDGSMSPYELNINYFSILQNSHEETTLSVKRFLLSQSIMLIMPGVPGIYFHSLIGSVNYKEGVAKTGVLRSINREKLKLSGLEEELKTIQRRKLAFSFYMKMISVRKKEPAFSPLVPFKVLKTHKQVFAIERILKQDASLIAVHNMSTQGVSTTLTPSSVTSKKLTCLLTSITVNADKTGQYTIILPPNHFLWLKEEK